MCRTGATGRIAHRQLGLDPGKSSAASYRVVVPKPRCVYHPPWDTASTHLYEGTQKYNSSIAGAERRDQPFDNSPATAFGSLGFICSKKKLFILRLQHFAGFARKTCTTRDTKYPKRAALEGHVGEILQLVARDATPEQ